MKRSTRIKILIVDDVKEMRNHVEEIVLHSFPAMKTELASTVQEAIQKFNTQTPHFVLLDIGLRGESGLEVLRHIRKTKLNAKVIMVTNYADAVHRKICQQLEADAFVDKTKEFHLIPKIILRLMEIELNEIRKN